MAPWRTTPWWCGTSDLLAYDLGDHPLDPVRVELTMALARELGVLDRPGVRVVKPKPADDAAADPGAPRRLPRRGARRAARPALRAGTGSAPPDNPVFDAHARGQRARSPAPRWRAAEAVWRGEAPPRGEHRRRPAPRDARPGVRLLRLQRPGGGHRPAARPGRRAVAYVDVDVHHGDGVQADLLRRPAGAHGQPARDPLALFPGTGFPDETGGAGRRGHRGQRRRCRRAPTTPAGCARSTRSCRRCCARSARRCWSRQCGADAHRLDPLADLRLTVDGQRAAYLALRDARRRAVRRPLGGHRRRRVRAGRGGAAGLDPPAGVATGEPLDPATPTPAELAATWPRTALPGPARCPTADDRRRRPRVRAVAARPASRTPSTGRSLATRRAVFPLLGLDPHDPRD